MLTRENMITEILMCMKANGLYVSGDLFFQLAFMSEEGLRGICQELHINIRMH